MRPRHELEDPPTGGFLISLARVTSRENVPTVVPMPRSWPAAEFAAYLRQLMDAAGIPDFAELSRLTGVSQNQFSTWRLGRNQPSAANLKRIAPVLNVPPVKLFIMAGLASPDDLELAEAPDFRVIPQEFRDQIELHDRPELTDDHRTFLRRSAAAAVAAVLAEMASERGRPVSRRRAS